MEPVKPSSHPSAFVIGLALFSMFFGGGNLIYPLYVGTLAQGDWLWAALGFFLTGVVVPVSGVLAMLLFKGSYTNFFGSLGKKIGHWLTFILLTVWIPLGSSPRCITLSYSSLATYLPMPSLWVFSLMTCALVVLMVYKRSRLLDLLGYVLTPALLLCLGTIAYYGINAEQLAIDTGSPGIFRQSLVEGYNTMDLIASFFFSASIIQMLKSSTGHEKHSIRTTFIACVVGMSTLAIVYIGLIAVAASQAPLLVGVPKDQLLATIAKIVLGPSFGIVAAFAIFLACFTTLVALTVVYLDFLKSHVLPSKSGSQALAVTLGGSFGMSIFGLQGITAVTSPILQVFYPILIAMIIYHMISSFVVTQQVETA